MTEKQWRECLGEFVRDYIRSPELEYYFSIKMNKPRAAVMVKQQSLFVRHRRDCWAHVSANCPVLGVKQRILEHEYEEIIRDDFSDYGHLHLIIRQGKSVGLEPQEIINAEPLPETRSVLYAWSWMTSEMPWTESLAGMTITEWCNDDRLLGDLGGGQSTRMAKKWMEDMGFTWKQTPSRLMPSTEKASRRRRKEFHCENFPQISFSESDRDISMAVFARRANVV